MHLGAVVPCLDRMAPPKNVILLLYCSSECGCSKLPRLLFIPGPLHLFTFFNCKKHLVIGHLNFSGSFTCSDIEQQLAQSFHGPCIN